MHLMFAPKSVTHARKNFQNETRAIPCFTALFFKGRRPVRTGSPEFKTEPRKRKGSMKLDTLKTLYVDELRDLYNAENQLIKALPKMAKGASSEELQEAFEK